MSVGTASDADLAKPVTYGRVRMRTTIDIDAPILREVKALQAREGKSLGRLVSDLLARALKSDESRDPQAPREWIAKPMRARVDLQDKEALHRAGRLTSFTNCT